MGNMTTHMGITEASRKYSKGHFGNPPCEIGEYVWIRENGQEYPVTIREDTTEEKAAYAKFQAKFECLQHHKFGCDCTGIANNEDEFHEN